jgi:ribonuclease HI
MTKYELIFDGGSIGNPGKAYGSFRLQQLEGVGQTPGRAGAPIRLDFGHGTNNQAEYLALIAGVKELRKRLEAAGELLESTELEVRGDSKLVINQVAGGWKIKNPELLKLHDQVLDLLAGFGKVEFIHQPRSKSQRTLGH